MFETALASTRPRRRGTIILSTTLHAALTSALVFPPMLRMPELAEEPPDRMPKLVQLLHEAPKPEIAKPESVAPASPGGGGKTNVRVVTVPTEIPNDVPKALSDKERDDTREVLGAKYREPDIKDDTGEPTVGPENPTDGPISASAPGVTPPVALSTPSPAYPQAGLMAHMEGIVILEAVIDTGGQVTNVRVLRSMNALFDRAATDAVMKWRYRPALIGDHLTSVYLTVTVAFRINNR